MKRLNAQQAMEMVIAACDAIIASKPLLTEVDSKIGDGDHGIGMAGGMEKAKALLIERAPFADVNTVFKTTGMAMLNSMGGASGVIFGSMFLGGLKGMDSLTEMDCETFVTMMRKSLNAVKERGLAKVGDKTMVDAFEPAVLAMEAAVQFDFDVLLDEGAKAAAQGVEDSKKYIAKFGKAQYLGERAIGFQDAGATSVYIIFNAMHQYVNSLH